jgi:hypothetical protein
MARPNALQGSNVAVFTTAGLNTLSQDIAVCSGTTALELTAWFLGSSASSGYMARVCFGDTSNCSGSVSVPAGGNWFPLSVVYRPGPAASSAAVILQTFTPGGSSTGTVYADFVVVG